MSLRATRYRAAFAPLLEFCARAIAATTFLGVAISPSGAQQVTSIINYGLSSDGNLLSFAVPLHVGLYDWRTGTLAEIPAPPGNRISSLPVFATDGKSFLLTLGTSKDFGIYDLHTLRLKTTGQSDCESRGDSIYQSGDKAILTVVGDLPSRYLCLYDFEAARSQIILPKEQGFFELYSLSFIDQDEVLFIGRGPKDPDIAAKVRSLGANPVTATIPYRLKFGGRPEIAFPEILKRSRALLAPLQADGPTEILTSRNGEKVFYVDRSSSEEARVREARKHPGQYEGMYRYDLFMIESGVTRQVTQLEAFMGFPAVSYDGSTAALGLSVGEMTKEKYLDRRRRTFEPVIVDVSTGRITRTDLIARINADPRFGVK